MKRKISYLLLTALLAVSLSGCGSEKASADSPAAKTVKAQTVSHESCIEGYSYLGIVKAKETKNYSFLSGGKIAEIYVEKGQQFNSGDVLARLDTSTLEYNASIGENTKTQAEAVLQKTIGTYNTNITNAQSQIQTLEKSIAAGEKGIEALEIALAAEVQALDAEVKNIEAAENALNTLNTKLNAARKLNAAGIYTDLDLDSLESQYTTAKAELDAARAAHEGSIASHEGNTAELESKKAELDALASQKSEAEKTLENLYTSMEKDVAAAQADVKNAGVSNDIVNKNINDCIVTADSSGYVMELPYKEGEVISAGYPVVIAKSKELVVTIGASDTEYKDMVLGGTALINGEAVGKISSIAQYPDESSRTYAVDIAVDGEYTIGETVNVKVVTGSSTGFFVPINAVFNNDGVSYVYVVSDENKVYKKQVVLGDFQGDSVQIQIDDPNAVIVTEGVKNLKENDSVILEG